MGALGLVAAFVAYFAKGISGFANTLVFSSILSFRANNVEITPLDLALGLPSNIWMVWHERREVSLKISGPLILMTLGGLIPGVLILKNGDPAGLKALMGLLIVYLGFDTLRGIKKKEQKTGGKAAMIFIGLVSGLLCGLFGIGALLTAYVVRRTKNAAAFRGNICLVFLAENIFRVALYISTGILTWESISALPPMLPCMALGLWLGSLVAKRVNEVNAKRVVAAVLIVSGLSVFANNVGTLF